MCRGSRAQLRTAADEVQRQIKIITSTRKKQHSMEVLDVLSRVKKVKDLPAALRLAAGWLLAATALYMACKALCLPSLGRTAPDVFTG
jgi:hypothetical protein